MVNPLIEPHWAMPLSEPPDVFWHKRYSFHTFHYQIVCHGTLFDNGKYIDRQSGQGEILHSVQLVWHPMAASAGCEISDTYLINKI